MYDLECREGYEWLERNFLARLQKTERCWTWCGPYTRPNGGGYGRVMISGKTYLAHRLAYEIYKGDIPKDAADLTICHTCDDTTCVNPDHLFLGNIRGNRMDCVIKGRQARGESHGSRKLTDEKVREMRRLYATGKYTQAALAKKYNIDRPYCTKVINYRQWAHVKP